MFFSWAMAFTILDKNYPSAELSFLDYVGLILLFVRE